MAAYGHPKGWSANAPKRAPQKYSSANVRLCQGPAPKIFCGSVKAALILAISQGQRTCPGLDSSPL